MIVIGIPVTSSSEKNFRESQKIRSIDIFSMTDKNKKKEMVLIIHSALHLVFYKYIHSKISQLRKRININPISFIIL